MLSRLRSSSIGSLIDLASPRYDCDGSNLLPPNTPYRTKQSPNLTTFKRVSSTPSPLSDYFNKSRLHAHPSPQAERALTVSKGELTEVIELLQQARPNDLSQARALLSLMVAILSDTPKCRECMRENAGFLTLVTVLASLGGNPPIGSHSSPGASDEIGPNSAHHTRPMPLIEIIGDKECPLTDSPIPSLNSEQSEELEREEERDAVVTLVFKCLALGLSGHRENQLFFSTKVGYKLVLDALRLSNLIPQSSPDNRDRATSERYRREKIEKLFGILFSLIVADFSCIDIFAITRSRLNQPDCGNLSRPVQGILKSGQTPSPRTVESKHTQDDLTLLPVSSNLDSDSRYTTMSEILYQIICDRAQPLHVEIADAVLLLFALHADLLLPTPSSSQNYEDNYDLYFLSLKAIEILATTSKHSQIALNSIELTAVILERLAPLSGSKSPPSDAKHRSQGDLIDALSSAGLEPWNLDAFVASTQGAQSLSNKLGDRHCQKVAKAIIKQMLPVGTSSREARMLFRRAVRCLEPSQSGKEVLEEDYLELISLGMQSSNCPPFIHFGSSKDGCEYAVLDSLGVNPFPPVQSGGWTFAAWLQVESYGAESNAPLELLTISDSQQECFVRIAISTCSVIVQTAFSCHPSSSDPTVSDNTKPMIIQNSPGFSTEVATVAPDPLATAEFDIVKFEPGRFYHFAVVQQLGSKDSGSAMTLFIDGECVGQRPISWPKTPSLQRLSAHFGLSPSQLTAAFDFPSRRVTSGRGRPRWNLGGCWLFNQAIADDMLFVMFTLGPKIFTCFQDALGSFQTYSSSTLLNLKIDNLRQKTSQDPKGKPNPVPVTSRTSLPLSSTADALNKSPLIKAIKEPASTFVPQESIYFALSAKNGIVIPDRLYHGQNSPSSFLASSRSDQRRNHNDMNYMQKVYTTIGPSSFDSQIHNQTGWRSVPTSSAFGPSFANGILNASLSNSKTSDYYPAALESSTGDLSPLPMTPTPSKESCGSESNVRILELIGDVRLCCPKGLDDSIWKTSGSIFIVRLIQLSSTEKQLIMSLQIFLEAISYNWRLSEDAEKVQAYETLGLILKSKAHLITSSVHCILLRFAGINLDDSGAKSLAPFDQRCYPILVTPKDLTVDSGLQAELQNKGLRNSVITNPLAFQFLLLDFDLWSATSAEVQRFHFESLRGMIELSVWSRFNMKRICKMNLLPKMLHALRVRQFSTSSEGRSAISAFINLLACVLKVQFNPQVIRHLASYLTASLIPDNHLELHPLSDSPAVNIRKSQLLTDRSFANLDTRVSHLKSSPAPSTLDESIVVLKVLHDLLLSPNDQESSSFITRFLKGINGSKWLLMFFHEDAHPSVVCYSLRILTRLIQTQDCRWLQHFKNTLAGFTILRSVLTEFCFQNESIVVTTLSLLSQVDIRTVPMFSTTEPAISDTVPLMWKDELQGVIRSIRGIPNELITPELLPVVIGLLKPAHVNRCSQETKTSIYVMEWLNLRMESQDDGWNEMLGDKELVKVWANYVTLLYCLPYQKDLHPVPEKIQPEASRGSPEPTSEGSCLFSFPLTFSSAGFDPATQIQAGICTKFPSTHQSNSTPFIGANGQFVAGHLTNQAESSGSKSTIASSTSRVTFSSSNGASSIVMIDEDAVTLPHDPVSLTAAESSNASKASQLKHSFGGSDSTSASISLYCYGDASEDTINNLSKLTESFLISYVFDQDSNLTNSKLSRSDTGKALGKSLRPHRMEQLLHLVINRTGYDRAWITPFINKVVEVIVLQSDPSSIPLDWLSSILADGYLSGWLQPDARSVTQLVTFLTAKKPDYPIAPLGDLLMIVLANRFTSSPEILLEQLCSHHLANLIAAMPPELVPRLVYILTQYLSRPSNMKTPASHVLKLLFSYHPLILEEFCLNIDSSNQVMDRSSPFSASGDAIDSPSMVDFSMSQVEKDLSKVLQMQPNELKDVLENSSSINLTGKLDWIRFVTESELKASRTRAHMQTKSRVMWIEYLNKSVIETRRLERVIGKLEAWARSVKEIDAVRFANLRQDNFDTKHYLEMQLSKRLTELYRPFSVLSKPRDDIATYWALDSTEGPSRQRKKLRRLALKLDTHLTQRPKPRHYRMRSLGTSRRDSYRYETTDELKKDNDYFSPTSPMHHETFMSQNDIWDEEPGEYVDEVASTVNKNSNTLTTSKPTLRKSTLDQNSSSSNGVDNQVEDFNEDKSRRILKSLEAGDVIQGVWNVEQVIGLDTCPALFLMAKNNIYIIDGFFQKSNGELVNSWEAWQERDPHLRTLASLSRQTVKLNSRAAAHQSRRWAYSDIVSISSRKWLFRDICIEFSFADGRSRLLTFSDNKRDDALKRLKSCIRKSVGSDVLSNMNLSLKSQTELWQNGQISNQSYLLYLNDAAGRTYRDLTQHPVFPWILADYTSSKLDLEKPESFRKLDLPMGAQTETRKRDFIERFRSLEEFGTIGDERMKPAHYMTHYSSAVVVCGFLIRLQPFCDHFIEIQGSFDHADRTFWSIHRAWLSASEQSRSDVRELIPEFFHCPEFLLNLNKLSLGSRQEGGDPVGDVVLPPWAHGDPRLFVELHREALESDFVSSNIHNWIDLIFGYKQRGQAALDAVNVFQEVSYEGTVSLDAIDDDRERSSVMGAMCNWGLTPSQIFETPHPMRGKQAKHPLEPRSIITAATCPALIQSTVPIRDIKQPVGHIHPDKTFEKIFVSGPQSLLVPPDASHRLEWGFLDQTLRIFDFSNSLCGTFEGVSSEHISTACFADHRTLVTGSTDSTISLWRFAWLPNGGAHLQQIEVLRGHSAPITCAVASRTLSIVVSGAEDGLAIIWDLNRALLVQSLPHSGPVSYAAISESTGDIATCTQNTIRLWSINGDLLSTLAISQYTLDPITACCWSRAEVKPMLVTGHRGGKLMFWQRQSVHGDNPDEPWKIAIIHTTNHEARHGSNEIRALSMTDRTLLSGDSLGQLFCWSLPGSACLLPDSATSSCMLCEHRFGILESKRRCTSCSAIICSSCQRILSGWGIKCCSSCLPKLSKLPSTRQS